jgi:ubiquinone/menaquinone biosynthesis C-methylase UbiE
VNVSDEVRRQRQYYAATSQQYDAMHGNRWDEHDFALSFLVAACDYLEARSVLDIGSGTGRAIRAFKERRPGIRIVGVEPVAELRERGYEQGIQRHELVDGDAMQLIYKEGEFDMVCEFGVLHHVLEPAKAVAEMLRVAKHAIFISDSNNFGQGSGVVRAVKQILNACGLWRVADLIKTKGKGYTVSEGDGLAYSYSVFNNYNQIRKQCERIHLMNTKDGSFNLYRTAEHIALLGVKKVG